jgi:hypothetical protein
MIAKPYDKVWALSKLIRLPHAFDQEMVLVVVIPYKNSGELN